MAIRLLSLLLLSTLSSDKTWEIMDMLVGRFDTIINNYFDPELIAKV
jgi:hypothetical protein